MDCLKAENIVNGYAAAVAKGFLDRDLVRYESWLPCSKDRIVSAYKIFFAYVIKFKTLSRDDFKKHLMILNYIDTFVEDAQATKINVFWKLDTDAKKEFQEQYPEITPLCKYYSDHILISKGYEDVINFVQEVQKLDCHSQFYCRKIYELAQIKYLPRYEKFFRNSSLSVG
ncbi:MAG: hypothetical protein GYA42_03535 [Syntrophomonadaceae bacterium]|nr:hypothetical protein [Syntrophomonadaceae bacterium]